MKNTDANETYLFNIFGKLQTMVIVIQLNFIFVVQIIII